MSNKYPLFIILLLALTAVLSLSGSAGAAPSTNFEVISLDDDGQGSLRQAIIAANSAPGKDTITFGVSGTITLKSTLPTVGDDLTIDGSDQEIRISGDNQHRVLNLIAGNNIPELVINKLVIEKGRSGDGAAVFNDGGFLTVTNVTFNSNMAISAVDPTYGGAIFNSGGGVSVINSIFALSMADYGGAIYNSAGTLTINGSSFLENKGVYAGGALYNLSGTTTATNSTFSLNEGGVGVVFNYTGKTTITNSTFSKNDAGGAVAGSLGNDSSLTLQNTILHDVGNKNCLGVIVNGGNNIDSGATCAWGSEKGSMSSTDPKVSGVTDNGGPTPTVLLLPGSPAIDGVLFDAPNACPAADQRGVPRTQGSACDIGALETNRQPGPNFIVNVLADTNDGSCDALVSDVTNCTLREAIIASNARPGKDTITFDVGGPMILSDTLPVIGDDLLIDAEGKISVGGGGNFRHMTLRADNTIPELELRELNLYEGFGDKGAVIFNDGGDLILTKVFFDDSEASEEGGAIYNNGGSVTMYESWLAANSAKSGAGVFSNGGTLTINKSTFYLNKSTADGGVIFSSSGSVEVINSTFYENQSDAAGILSNSAGTTLVTNSTFAKNETKNGSISNKSGSLTLQNTILDDAGAKNCTAGITNGGNNIDSGATCAWGTDKGSMSSTDPMLDRLANNGGPTNTTALLPGSPAIDAVLFDVPNNCPAEDQRGITRPQGAACDIGAYEADAVPAKPIVYLPVVMTQ